MVTEMYPHDVNAFINYKVPPLFRRCCSSGFPIWSHESATMRRAKEFHLSLSGGEERDRGNEQVGEMLHSVCRHAVKSAMRALKPCLTQSVSRCACPEGGKKSNFKGRLCLILF